jgi:hypothetical protein
VIWKLSQHILIWLAASAIIVVGLGAAYTYGINPYHTNLDPIGLLAAACIVIFAAALVQRSPIAITILVVCAGALGLLGIWLLADGARFIGLAYTVIGATYVAGLGPSCLRWITRRS